jgi:uncharacterized repeat protein (TIGR02543 family)
MSTGQYTHTTRAAGTIVTSTLYNTAHSNQLANDIPTSAGAHADDVTQYRATTDPAPGGTAAPVADLGTELEQLRYVLLDIKTVLNSGTPPSHWYTPIAPLDTQRAGKGARVYRNTTQSISTKTTTACLFNTVRYDTGVVLPTFDPFWSVGTPSRLTAQKTGVYQITGFVQWDTGVISGDLAVFIRLNGTKLLAAEERALTGSAESPWQQVGCQYQLAKGDYVELVVFQTMHGPFNVINPEFGLELLAASAVTPPPVLRTLTVAEGGSGSGTVAWSPTNDGSVSPETFVDGTSVTLTPTATGGVFVGWTGDVPSGHEQDNPLTVTMNQDRSITANFAAQGALIATDANGALTSFSGTKYLSLTTNIFQSGTEGTVAAEIPRAITLTGLYVKLDGSGIPVGVTVTCKFVVNGTPSSAIVATGSGGQVGYPVLTGSGTLALSANDKVSVQIVTTGVGSITVQAITARYTV